MEISSDLYPTIKVFVVVVKSIEICLFHCFFYLCLGYVRTKNPPGKLDFTSTFSEVFNTMSCTNLFNIFLIFSILYFDALIS